VKNISEQANLNRTVEIINKHIQQFNYRIPVCHLEELTFFKITPLFMATEICKPILP